jgi:SAM-dependent methyltransferase
VIASIKRSIPYKVFRGYNKALWRYLSLPRYLGRAYTCPVCGVGLRSFKPMWKSYGRDIKRFGYVHRHTEMETLNLKDHLCPKCNATDRERLMAVYLDNAWRAFAPGQRIRMVDFAPAYPLSIKIRRYPAIDYRTADLLRSDVDDRIDLTNINYPDRSLDVFICSHILEHIPDDRQAMRELHRILKPDGFGLVLVPLVVGVEETHEDPAINTSEGRWKYFGMGDHVRQYGKRDFLNRLSEAGFAVEQLGVSHFGRDAFRRHGIADNSVLYVVRRA